jgi:Flp pilus assembly protein TadB
MASSERQHPERDGIYRTIHTLFIADIALGLALGVVGKWPLGLPAVAWTGLGLAATGLALLLFFRYLARRAARRPRS